MTERLTPQHQNVAGMRFGPRQHARTASQRDDAEKFCKDQGLRLLLGRSLWLNQWNCCADAAPDQTHGCV